MDFNWLYLAVYSGKKVIFNSKQSWQCILKVKTETSQKMQEARAMLCQ